MARTTCRLAVEALETRALPSTFYVAPFGADAAPGTAYAPWQTLQRAASAVRAGDTVVVQAGNYAGFNLTTSGTAYAPITFRAQPGAAVTSPNAVTGRDGINLEGAGYVVIDGFTVTAMPRAGIRAVTDNHVTIRNNRCDSNGTWGIFTGFSDSVTIENNVASRSQAEHGIYVSNSCVNPVVRGNECWGNARCGIHMNGDAEMGGPGVITGAVVAGNVIHDNGTGGGSGINADGVQSSRFENNLLYNNHASGISLYRIDAAAGARNNVVVNNTVVMAADARWALNVQNGSTGNVVFNNILFNANPARGSVNISADSLPGFASDYNVVVGRFTTDDEASVLGVWAWRAATGQDLHSLVAATLDQVFVNAAGGDYHPAAFGPAVDAGAAGFAGFTAPGTDLGGLPRPGGAAFDIGAYEVRRTWIDYPPPDPDPEQSPGDPGLTPGPGGGGATLDELWFIMTPGMSSAAVTPRDPATATAMASYG